MLLKSFSYAMIGVFAFGLVMTFAGSAKLLMAGGM